MSTEATTETIPATTPVVVPTPAKQQGKPNGNGKPRGPEVRIPQAAFKARLQREAAAEVRRRLGISIDEAEAIVKKTASPAGTPAGVATDVVAKLQAEKAKLEAEITKSKKATADLEAKHKKDVQRLKDKQTEAELKFMAKGHGIVDVDYAIHLFARAAASGQATDPQAYFGSLKNSHVFLFQAPVATTVVETKVEPPAIITPVTTPPESTQPGEVKPPVAAATTGGAGPDVDKLDGPGFNRHMRSKYGYVPGM